MQAFKLASGLRAAYRGSDGRARAKRLDGQLDKARRDGAGDDSYDHAETVAEYYNLCSDLMVFGWGESLHFAPLSPAESLEESKIRHQRLMIAKLELSEGMNVIDVGCGIGGPMRRVVTEGRVRVLGVNASERQLQRARELNAEAGLEHRIDLLACSFMDMSAVTDGTFDRGYAIESTCHAPNKAEAFAEIYRVLKPGALLWGQEMCMTDVFDPDDSDHQAIKQGLMHGIALKGIATTHEVNRDLEAAGFEIAYANDFGVIEDPASETPWYRPMETRGETRGGAIRQTPLARKAMLAGARLAETVRIFPRGTADIIGLLDDTAHAYVSGGKTGIFTPLYCFVARKPA